MTLSIIGTSIPSFRSSLLTPSSGKKIKPLATCMSTGSLSTLLTLMLSAVNSSETLVDLGLTARRHILEYTHFASHAAIAIITAGPTYVAASIRNAM
jgi:hypothetical protein